MTHPDSRGRLLAHIMWEEIEKISQTAQLPQAGTNTQAFAQPDQGAVPQETALEESPGQEILGTHVQQITKKDAKGIPSLPPPPGYVFDPELAAFVPDMQQPGWLTEQQAAVGQNNKGYYDTGQQDAVTQQAQAQLDQQAQQDVDQQQQAQFQQQQADQAQQIALQKEQNRLATPKNIVGQAALEAPSGAPAVQEPTKPKPKAKKPAERGITIKVGK